jgi:hypothetical protein
MGALSTGDVYRPLSLFAMGAFLASVLYTAGMGIATLVALIGGTPLLLPGWMMGVPIATAVLAWAARRHILGAEGTLSGQALTSWGLGLSLGVGLTYVAYYFGTYVAIKQQASAVSDQYLELLKKGEVDKAFLLTIPAERRPPADENLREALHVAFAASRGGVVAFPAFQASDQLRMFRNSPQQIDLASPSVGNWEYDPKGGYKVTLRYPFETVEATGQLFVTAIGRDPRGPDDEGRRQWHISAQETGLDKETVRLTTEGDRRYGLANGARRYAEAFMSGITNRQLFELWQASLPPGERLDSKEKLDALKGPRRAWSMAGVAGVAGLGAAEARGRAQLLSQLAFEDGGLVRAGQFYSNPKQRDEILGAVRGLFNPGEGGRFGRASPGTSKVPAWSESDEKVSIAFEVQLMIANPSQRSPEWTVEGQVVIECPSSTARASSPEWRIAALDLTTGHSGAAGGGNMRTMATP